MRRILIVLGALAALLLLAVATLPFWLGAALRPAGERFGLEYSKYERVGYGRFALRDVAYRSDALRFSAERVELASPTNWLWRGTFGDGADVVVNGWRATLTPSDSPEVEAPTDGPSGWMPMRDTIRRAVAQAGQWVDSARLVNGTVEMPDRQIAVPLITWDDRTLVARDVAYQDFNVDVRLAVPEASDEISVAAELNGDEAVVTLASRGSQVEGELRWWGQPASISADFGPTGWLPETAGVVARDWTVSGDKLQLADTYREIAGDLQVTWRDERFAAEVAVQGAPVDAEQLPPLDVDLRAHGSLEAVTVDVLQAQAPGLNLELSNSVTLDRQGKLQGEPALLAFTADLAEQPWFTATGTIAGEARVTSAAEGSLPRVTFQLTARDIQAEGVAVQTARAEGQFDSPRLELESATLEGEDGTRLTLKGAYHLETKAIAGAFIQGEISRNTLARWLPEQPAFETVAIEASAEGVLPEVQHRGQTRIDAVEMNGLRPLDVTASWQGAGRILDQFSANVSAGDSQLTLEGALTAEHVQLNALTFAPNGRRALALDRPATVAWAPQVQLSNLTLSGPDDALAHVDLTWGQSGQAAVALRGFRSDWLRDFLEKAPPEAELTSLAVNGAWADGPATFSAVAGARVRLDDGQMAQAHLDAQGDADGVRLNALRVSAGDDTVVNASGFAPVALAPAGDEPVAIDEQGRVAFTVATTENAAFWRELGKMTGLELQAPRVRAAVSGTWARPEGEVQVNAERIAFTGEDGGARLPPIERLNARLHGTPDALVLETFAFAVAGQTVTAGGTLPVPARGWEALAEQPLEALRNRADLRIRIPDAAIAAFAELLPEAVMPRGRVHVDVALQDGKLAGSVTVDDAATRPLGPAGALRNIQVDLQLDDQTVTVRNISAETGGETVQLEGRIGLPTLESLGENPGEALRKLDYELTLTGNNLPFVRQTGLLVRGDLDLKLSTPESGTPEVSGTVRLRDSLFLQDIRSLLPGDTRSKSSRPPYFVVEAEPLSQWELSVDVVGTEFMRLQATGFSGVASARFRLDGTLGDPVLLGDAIIDRGQVKFPFATFSVQNGRVSLTRANPYEPQIELTATTRRYAYDLTLEVTGDASSPEVKFESSPPLEHGQVLQMVVAGIVPRSDVSVTQADRATAFGSYLGQNLFSSLTGGGDSSRLSITSGEDISEEGRETYRLEYNLNDRWSLTHEYDEYDTRSFGVKWQALTRGGSTASATDENREVPASPGEADDNGDADAAREEKADEEDDEKEAEIDVKGLGFFGALEMEATLKRLLGDERRGTLDTNAVEDALFLLMASIQAKGYLHPEIDVMIVPPHDRPVEFTMSPDLGTTLPRPMAAEKVTFTVRPGQRYLVEEVDFSGLQAIETDEARPFFAGEPGLFSSKAARVYTPQRIAKGAENLAAELRGRGYAEASVSAEVVEINDETGQVRVAVEVEEGPRWHIADVQFEGVDAPGVTAPVFSYAGEPWSEAIEQDIRAALRNAFLAAGYPDVRVQVSHSDPRAAPDQSGAVVDLAAKVTPGPQVTLGDVRYEGLVKTQESVLDRRVENEPGEPLNLLALERARYRISRLGVFERVDLELDPEEGPVRDAVFSVVPGRRLELNLLAGYNTYEQLRAGVEFRRYNLWGRAHHTRGLLVQSLKSTRGEYTYSVPELFGEDVNGSARLFGLQREEVAFLRQEYGIELAVATPLSFLGANATAGYTFEVLRNEDNELQTSEFDRSQVEVASLNGALTRDRRDNPLLPRDGYRWFGRAEAASQFLGGRAEYQRFEFGASYHTDAGEGRWWHFNLTHGVVTTFGEDDDRLPVNKRFFPGGDGSIRGYNDGEAAPREGGRYIGAKSYLAATVEFEQALIQNLSGVVFVDGLGMSAQLANYPIEETLVSVGLGVRYQTVVGPIRLEYGHNLNRRPGDPTGTFHFSVGFPF